MWQFVKAVEGVLMLADLSSASEIQITKVARVRPARCFLITIVCVVQQELKASCCANHVRRGLIAVALHRYVPSQVCHADKLDVTNLALDALGTRRL